MPDMMLDTLIEAIPTTPRFDCFGRVTRVVGLVIEATGLDVGVGELCRVTSMTEDRSIMAEVVGFNEQHVILMPLGELDFGVSYENHTSYPAPGQIILYPGGISETEILLAYGGVHFASKMGQLAGNHFITLTSGLENLTAFGKAVLWKGAQKIRFEEI